MATPGFLRPFVLPTAASSPERIDNLDVYRPESTDRRRPAIVFVHGGPPARGLTTDPSRLAGLRRLRLAGGCVERRRCHGRPPASQSIRLPASCRRHRARGDARASPQRRRPRPHRTVVLLRRWAADGRVARRTTAVAALRCRELPSARTAARPRHRSSVQAGRRAAPGQRPAAPGDPGRQGTGRGRHHRRGIRRRSRAAERAVRAPPSEHRAASVATLRR